MNAILFKYPIEVELHERRYMMMTDPERGEAFINWKRRKLFSCPNPWGG